MGEEYGGSGRIIVPKKVADTYRKFGELLVQKQLVDPKHVDEALALPFVQVDPSVTHFKIGVFAVTERPVPIEPDRGFAPAVDTTLLNDRISFRV